eukprot:9484448-Pyramimonas_sp.AAC.2
MTSGETYEHDHMRATVRKNSCAMASRGKQRMDNMNGLTLRLSTNDDSATYVSAVGSRERRKERQDLALATS